MHANNAVRSIITGAVVGGLILTSSSTAIAAPGHESLNETEVRAMEKALTSSLPEGALSQESSNGYTEISASSPGTVKLDGATLTIPLNGAARTSPGTKNSTVVATNNADYLVKETEAGAQVLFNIDSSSDQHSKSFTIAEGKTLSTGREMGVDTGEVFVLNADGSVHSSFETPWAYDAEGKSVPTHFEVAGNTLTQVVEPTDSTVYPIVADPDWGKISLCLGTIVGNAALYIVPGGIVGKLLLKGNSIRKAATILVRTLKAKSYNAKLKSLRTLGLSLGADLTGIGAIAKACG